MNREYFGSSGSTVIIVKERERGKGKWACFILSKYYLAFHIAEGKFYERSIEKSTYLLGKKYYGY